MSRFMYRILLSSLLVLFSSLSNIASASSGNGMFAGLWEGIDEQDGSRVLVSISEGNGKGGMMVRLSDSFFSRCVELGYDSSPGLVEGSATVDGRTLTWDASMKCFNSSGGHTVITEIHYFHAGPEGNTLVDENGAVYFRINR
jgi:hypothetical protein